MVNDDTSFLSFHQWVELLDSDGPTRMDAGVQLKQEVVDRLRGNDRMARSLYAQYLRDYEDGTGILVTPRETRPALQLGVILAGFALVALLPMPGWYYDLLRCALCVGAITIGVLAIRSLRFWWLALPVVVMALWGAAFGFSPGREVWAILDIAVAAAFIAAGLLIPAPGETHDNDGKPIRYSEWWKFGIGAAVLALFLFGSVQAGADERAFCAEMAEQGGSCERD